MTDVGKELKIRARFSGAEGAITALDLFQNEVFVGTKEGELIAWKVPSQRGGSVPMRRYASQEFPVRGLCVRDGLIFCGVGAQIRVFDAETEELLGVCEREGRATAFVTQLIVRDYLIYAAYTDHVVRVWKDGQWRGSYRGHTATVLCLRIVGRDLYTGSKDKTIRMWNLRQARPHMLWEGRHTHNGPIWDLLVEDGILFFTDTSRVLIQELATGDRLQKLEGHEGDVRRLLFTPHDGFLYTAGVDGTVRIWKPELGQQLGIANQHSSPVTCMLIDRRNTLYTGSSDKTAIEWCDGPPGPRGIQMEYVGQHQGGGHEEFFDPPSEHLMDHNAPREPGMQYGSPQFDEQFMPADGPPRQSVRQSRPRTGAMTQQGGDAEWDYIDGMLSDNFFDDETGF